MGDFFQACMDEKAVEAAGARPIASDLAAIDALKSKAAMAALVARLHLFVDGGMLFGFGSEQSFENSDEVVAWLTAGGLGLPDRDYYVKDDERSKGIREAYVAHVAEALRLSGVPAEKAEDGARTVMRIETALAKASLTMVEKRDPKKIWHRTPVADLVKGSKAFGWGDYLALSGAPKVDWVNVTEPAFVKELDRLLAKESLASWKTYLRWHLVRAASPFLSTPFQKSSSTSTPRGCAGRRSSRPAGSAASAGPTPSWARRSARSSWRRSSRRRGRAGGEAGAVRPGRHGRSASTRSTGWRRRRRRRPTRSSPP